MHKLFLTKIKLKEMSYQDLSLDGNKIFLKMGGVLFGTICNPYTSGESKINLTYKNKNWAW